jgi:hypothetical protein
VIYSRSRRFAFIHNPKAAGTAFRNSLSRYHDHPSEFWGVRSSSYSDLKLDFAHLRLWELQIEAPCIFCELPSVRTVAFVRDPVPRFISAVFEHCGQYRPEVDLNRMSTADLRRFILRFISDDLTLEKVINDYRYVHFSPQSWFIYLGNDKFVEQLFLIPNRWIAFDAAFDFLEVPRTPMSGSNRRSYRKWKTVICDDLINFVQDFYAIDYRIIGSFDNLDTVYRKCAAPAVATSPAATSMSVALATAGPQAGFGTEIATLGFRFLRDSYLGCRRLWN